MYLAHVVVFPPKTGSTTLRSMLASSSNCSHRLITNGVEPHALSDPGSSSSRQSLLAQGRGVATLREPCARFVSAVGHMLHLTSANPGHPYKAVLGAPNPIALTQKMMANETLRRLLRGDGAARASPATETDELLLLLFNRSATQLFFWPQARWSDRGAGVSRWWCLPTLAEDVAAFAAAAGCTVRAGATHLRGRDSACTFARAHQRGFTLSSTARSQDAPRVHADAPRRIGSDADPDICRDFSYWTTKSPGLCARVASLYPEDELLWRQQCAGRLGAHAAAGAAAQPTN
jgi:hypothetical protein